MAEAVPLATAPAGSLYEMLRVRRAATQVEIKAAYRAMAKRLHPDAASRSSRIEKDAAAFLEIQRAYETLSDPDARAEYDRSLGPPTGRGRAPASSCECVGGKPTSADSRHALGSGMRVARLTRR